MTLQTEATDVCGQLMRMSGTGYALGTAPLEGVEEGDERDGYALMRMGTEGMEPMTEPCRQHATAVRNSRHFAAGYEQALKDHDLIKESGT